MPFSRAVVGADLSNPGIKLTSLCLPHWQMGSLPLALPGMQIRRKEFRLKKKTGDAVLCVCALKIHKYPSIFWSVV